MSARRSARRRPILLLATAVALVAGAAPLGRAADPPTPYPGGTWKPPAATYGTGVDRGLDVRMDDGVVLKVDVTYPTDPATGRRAAGPFPVLVNQDMYTGGLAATADPNAVPGEYFAQRGYLYVHLHDRGTGGSEGHFDPGFGPRVGLDGVELSYWAADPANVPGANGRVGLQGCSALGVVQLSTLAALGVLLDDGASVHVPGPTKDAPGRVVPATDATNPIKASLPECVGTSVYHEQYTDNGVPSFINLLSLAQPAAQPVLIGYNLQDPSSNTEQSTSSLDMMTGGDPGYYRDHWKERDFIRRADQIARTDVPVLTWVGWKEGGPIGTQPLYAALQNAAAGRNILGPMAPGQAVSPKYQTLIGDWGHAGGLDEGIELQWFETWVMGRDTGLEKADQPVHLKELPSASTARWINATSYPITSSYTALYLDRAGALSPSAPLAAGSEQLAWGAGPPVTYTVATASGEDRTIAGPASVRVWLQSSNTNAHLFLQLLDVAPDGSSTPITHGSILGARRRTDPARSWSASNGLPVLPHLTLEYDEPLTPNVPVQLDVPLQPTAWRLLAGHKLQLKVATNAGDSCSPTGALFAPPVGCVFSIPTAQSLAGGVYTVLHDPAHPSAVNVPLVRSADLRTAQSGATPTSDGAVLPVDWGSGGRRPKA